jgi:hypothetical protein
MKQLLLAASAITFFSAPPAHAQLLSGSGIGSATGSIGGAIGPVTRQPMSTVRSVTRARVRGDAETSGRQKVDRKSGAVSVDRSIDSGVTATSSQLLDTPSGSTQGSAKGSGRASGSGSADAQLIGTDTLRGAVDGTASRGRAAVGTASKAASDGRQRAGNLAGSASGSAAGAASGAGSIGPGMLAVAGSGAAAAEGAFAVAPGMSVMAPDGAKVGKVRQIIADKRGRVQQIIVDAKGQELTVPGGNLAVAGDALVMGKGSATAN